MRYWYFVVEVKDKRTHLYLKEASCIAAAGKLFPSWKALMMYEYEFGTNADILILNQVEISKFDYDKHRYRPSGHV